MAAGPRSVYDYVAYESNVEKQFAEDLACTPEGEKLFFVAETKDTPFVEALRESEKAKIHCGGQHFEALRVMERPAEYRVVRAVEELLTPPA